MPARQRPSVVLRQRLGRGVGGEPVRRRPRPRSGSSRSRRSRRRSAIAAGRSRPAGSPIDQAHVAARRPAAVMLADRAEGGDDAGEHSGPSSSRRIRSACRRRRRARPRAHEARHGGERVDAERLRRRPAVAAHHGRRMEPGDPVHQIGAQQGRGQLRAALDQNRVSPASPSASSADGRSTPISEPPTSISAHAGSPARRARRAGSAPSRCSIQVGCSAAVATSCAVSGVRRWLSATMRTIGTARDTRAAGR